MTGSYNISIRRSAEKELRRLSKAEIPHLVEKIKGLSENPRPASSKMLQGEEKYRRLRVGNYRIIYGIDDSAKAVMIVKIGHRKEVYS